MNLHLSPGPTSLERLDAAIRRLLERHAFRLFAGAPGDWPAGLCALLLTEDPQRNPEVLDACVILPEALKPLGDRVSRRVAGPGASQPLMRQYAVARAPAVVFLRDGLFVGALNGIRDWREYQEEVARLLDAPVQPKPIGIPVRGESVPGACA